MIDSQLSGDEQRASRGLRRLVDARLQAWQQPEGHVGEFERTAGCRAGPAATPELPGAQRRRLHQPRAQEAQATGRGKAPS